MVKVLRGTINTNNETTMFSHYFQTLHLHFDRGMTERRKKVQLRVLLSLFIDGHIHAHIGYVRRRSILVLTYV